MKVLVAGATGVVGRQLVPRLLDQGHKVVGPPRPQSKAERLAPLGAEIGERRRPGPVGRDPRRT